MKYLRRFNALDTLFDDRLSFFRDFDTQAVEVQESIQGMLTSASRNRVQPAETFYDRPRRLVRAVLASIVLLDCTRFPSSVLSLR